MIQIPSNLTPNGGQIVDVPFGAGWIALDLSALEQLPAGILLTMQNTASQQQVFLGWGVDGSEPSDKQVILNGGDSAFFYGSNQYKNLYFQCALSIGSVKVFLTYFS